MPWDPVSRLLFPAPSPSYGPYSFPEELLLVPKELELGPACPLALRVPCALLKFPSARFLILYLHSNAEDLGKCYGFCNLLRVQFQVHVLVVEYPGYGICPGPAATAASVTENAFAAFRFVREVLQWPAENIKILGRSIGTGPAVALAVQYKVAGVILIAPFLSIKALLRDTVGFLSHLVEERFPSKDRVHLVQSPLLIIHGQKDLLIPCRHGAALYDLCRSRKLFVSPVDMEHNTNLLLNAEHLAVPMLRFFALPDYCFQELRVPPWAFAFAPRPVASLPAAFPDPIGPGPPPRPHPGPDPDEDPECPYVSSSADLYELADIDELSAIGPEGPEVQQVPEPAKPARVLLCR